MRLGLGRVHFEQKLSCGPHQVSHCGAGEPAQAWGGRRQQQVVEAFEGEAEELGFFLT